MKQWALITGASSGIGWELAVILARRGYHCVLTARRADRLADLKEKLVNDFGVKVETVAVDLTDAAAPQTIYEKAKAKNIDIDILVNNAGFGKFVKFSESEPKNMFDMLEVNVMALTRLTRLFLDGMVQRGRGRILNVSSMAGFAPGPFMAVYFASKAYVTSFSEALASELKGTGVTVTVLCPGATKSEFQAVAYNENPAVTMKKNIPTSKDVAEFGYMAMMRNQVIAIPQLRGRVASLIIKLLPRSVVRRIARLKQERGK